MKNLRNFWHIDKDTALHYTESSIDVADAIDHHYLAYNFTEYPEACMTAKMLRDRLKTDVIAEFDLGWVGRE
jgi:cell fate (sporulation/competence/biofilm development) regulator YmcA (YheA/YmcA/DUF963 family)